MTKGTEVEKAFDVARLLGGCCTFSMVAMNAILRRKRETIEDCWMDVPGREAVL
jgi:hypothetical protein